MEDTTEKAPATTATNNPLATPNPNLDPYAASNLTIPATPGSRTLFGEQQLSLSLTAVGPSPTLSNFRTFKPPDMTSAASASASASASAAASLLSSYFSESYKKTVMRRGFVTTSAMPESSKRQLGRVRPFGKGPDNPTYTNTLESYSKGELFVEPVWMGSASRSLSRSGRRPGKKTIAKTTGRPGTTPLATPAGPVETVDNDDMLPTEGSIDVSSFGSFTVGKTLFSGTDSFSLTGAPPRAKTTDNMFFKYSVVKSKPLPPKKKAFSNSPILARLSNPNGNMALEMKKMNDKKKEREAGNEEDEEKEVGGNTKEKKKTKKKRKSTTTTLLRKKIIRKKKLVNAKGGKSETEDKEIEGGAELDEEQREADQRRRKELAAELREERMAAHKRKQREAASILRQQAMWAGIANLMKRSEELSIGRGIGEMNRAKAALAQDVVNAALEVATSTIENMTNTAFAQNRTAMINGGGGGDGKQQKQALTLVSKAEDTGGLSFVLGGGGEGGGREEGGITESTREKAVRLKSELLMATAGSTA
ncbi:hypothetical protein TrCOL_g2346 [Triparma columacea]|uniref:Uncharacterized protein n=1 Tax=Triparma columacea TaxID=722753 RepID=A0A9W7LCE4_9STRA|nr:hypothetical protein TrCOL_g2346 [Triparma columacea]